MATETQVYGAWEDLAAAPVLSQQTLTLPAAGLARYWRRCSLSADFWARYAALWVPASVPPDRLRRSAVESVLQYMLNELFENCAKFSGDGQGVVGYASWQLADRLVFQLSNPIRAEQQAAFTGFIRELLENDPTELYFQRLERNAESDHHQSGLGYLTLIKDYGVRFGFQFGPQPAGGVTVAVQAHVSLKEA